jgi:PAS domain S-box-containing protein
VLVATSAAALVLWNGYGIAQFLRRAPAQTAQSGPVTVTPLDPVAEEVRKLLAEDPPQGARQTDLALRAVHACDAHSRHRPALQRLSAANPSMGNALTRAATSISAACAMRVRFGRVLPGPERAMAAVELRSHLSQALGAIDSARAELIVSAAARLSPVRSDSTITPQLRDNLIGLAGGLICLVFTRRPRVAAAVPIDGSATSAPPLALEPSTYRNTVLRLLDDSGSFFFSEVFDRAPVPLVLLDGDGRILRLNAEAEALAGRSTPELRRKRYWDALVPESSREAVRDGFATAEGESSTTETWIKPDGSEHALTWKKTRFGEGASGDAVLVLLAGQPLSALPPAEAFASEAVHASMRELENELTLIGGYCDLVQPESGSATGAGDLVHMAKAVERALDAARRLLAGLGRRN